MSGVIAYVHDVLYIATAVQFSTAVWRWFYLLYLSIPAYGLVKLWQMVLHPYFFSAREDTVVDEETQKRLDKAAKRAERRKVKYMR
jgi:hypothetical protein